MQKFVIVSEIRSGYQLLGSSLNSHRKCSCFGEIFGSDPKVRQLSFWGKRIKAIQDEEDPEIYLEKKFFPKTRNKAVGFKLNYVCASKPKWKHLWQKIRIERWKIIHLTRWNLLNRLLSQKLAIKEHKWQHANYEEKVNIDFQDLDFHCKQSNNWQNWLRSYYKNNEIFELEYKEVIPRFKETLQFLGLPKEEMLVKMKKQRIKSQSDHISNYKEIYRECIKQGKYQEYFEEPLM